MLSFSTPPLLLLPILISFQILIPTAAAAADPPSTNATVYDLLPQFFLPPGLLPDSVISYNLSSDGSFVVELSSPCYVQFEYLVYYDKTITGTLKVGGIYDLEGVEVRKFFIWLGVDGIKVDLPPSEWIYFDIGWITKKLEVEQFETVHSCDSEGVTKCGERRKSALWKVLNSFSFMPNADPRKNLEDSGTCDGTHVVTNRMTRKSYAIRKDPP